MSGATASRDDGHTINLHLPFAYTMSLPSSSIISDSDWDVQVSTSSDHEPARSSDPKPSVSVGPSDAENPFDAAAKADVILRSSDSVDFFVLKAILSLASPVFDDMFSIAQESSEGKSKNEMKNGLPIVDLAEDSATLYDLLPQLYPYPEELTDTLEVYTRAGKAAEKYAMDGVLQNLKRVIMNCGPMVEEPMATFAVAVHLGWVEVMREASLNTLAIPLRDLVSSDGQSEYLHFISAADYRELLTWRFACQDVLNEIFGSWTTTNTNVPHIRRAFGPHLLKRLKETGCARSTVLMDDRFVSGETMKSVYSSAASRGLTRKDIEKAYGSMVTVIENALSKVPLKINGIVVQAED